MNSARRLLLVRHGLPDYRGGHPGDIYPGPPLSDVGRTQARQAAEVVVTHSPRTVYSSPLTRARQTAEYIARRAACLLRVDPALAEWHRTERLHEVSVRLTTWLVRWLRGSEQCAAVVSHASPLLAIIRSALYLPHLGWHHSGKPERLQIASADRFEMSMAAVFELLVTPDTVTVACLFHPQPRVLSQVYGRRIERIPRPGAGSGENLGFRRANWLRLIGAGSPACLTARDTTTPSDMPTPGNWA